MDQEHCPSPQVEASALSTVNPAPQRGQGPVVEDCLQSNMGSSQGLMAQAALTGMALRHQAGGAESAVGGHPSATHKCSATPPITPP